ncbi:MAG: DUF2000 domain-containing protein [Actinomycetota bacterium]
MTEIPPSSPTPKIAVVVCTGLEVWQRLNVTAFVASGLATVDPDLVGEAYVDADGRVGPPMFAVPVRVFAGDEAAVTRAHRRAVERNLVVSAYVHEMFATMNDVDNRTAFTRHRSQDMSPVGFAVAGDPKQVDKALDKLRLHP